MHKRPVAWTIVVICAQVLAGCGRSDSVSNLLAPSSPFSPLAPRSLPIDLTGEYVLTFEAGNSCEQLPSELRTRTYNASIGYGWPKQSGTGDYFYADLGGARFHGEFSRLVLDVVGNTVRFDLSDNIVAEKPAPDTYLMIAGSGGVASVESSHPSRISTSFDGFFEYCVTTFAFRPGAHCPGDAPVRAVCGGKDSRWTLTRR